MKYFEVEVAPSGDPQAIPEGTKARAAVQNGAEDNAPKARYRGGVTVLKLPEIHIVYIYII